MSERPSQAQYTGVLGFFSILRFSLSPRVPERTPSGSEPSEKGLGSPSLRPPNWPTTAPTHVAQWRLGIRSSYLCFPRAGGPKSIPKHTLELRDPFLLQGGQRGRREGVGCAGVLAFSQRGVFAYRIRREMGD